MVFQSYAILAAHDGFQNVSYRARDAATCKSRDPGKSKGIWRLVGLPGMEARYPSQLSGGQQRELWPQPGREPKILFLMSL